MKNLLLICAFIGGATAAKADALIDYSVLFENHAEKVVVTDNGGIVSRTLDLGDGVRNRCKGADGYDECVSIIVAEDNVAPDCLLASTAFTLILTSRCETGTAMQRFMLDSAFVDLGQTVALNAVPPRTWPELRQFVFDKIEPDVPQSCEKMDRNQLAYLADRLSLSEIKRVKDSAAITRLPAGGCLD